MLYMICVGCSFMNGSMPPLGGSGQLMKRSFSVNTSPVGHAFTIDLVRCPLFFAPPPPIKSIASTHQILRRRRGLVTARLRLVQLPLLTLLLPLAPVLPGRLEPAVGVVRPAARSLRAAAATPGGCARAGERAIFFGGKGGKKNKRGRRGGGGGGGGGARVAPCRRCRRGT